MKKLKFTKMHGLGNDFMVLDGLHQTIDLSAEQIALLGNRNTGIGFDQCLLIGPGDGAAVDFNYRIFNADGQEVGQCGNGARCLAVFAKHYGLTTKNQLTVATKTTRMTLWINSDDTVTVDMGTPKLQPQDIPLQAHTQANLYTLDLSKSSVCVHALSVGNPHAVLKVDNVLAVDVAGLGNEISNHPAFPEQTNSGFMQLINSGHIKLRVYERGCGETLACGSGAVAAAAVGRLFYQLDERIKVSLPGGDLIIEWPDLSGPISLTGPATFVYEGLLL